MGTASATGSDGSFQIAATPGPGYLVVQGPSDEYVLREMGAAGGAFQARPGSRRFYAHAYTFLDLKSENTVQSADIKIQRGRTVQGRVIGPDGQAVSDALIISRIVLRSMPTGGWKIWRALAQTIGHVRDGHFALHGLDPGTAVPVYFLDSEHELGATVDFSGRSARDGPVAVRLEPCGKARARLVDPGGHPVGGFAIGVITLIVTPGPSFRGNEHEPGRLFAHEASLPRLDPAHFGTIPKSDAQGRLVFPALIPGATYRLTDPSTYRDPEGPQFRKDFTVRPGETLDLGDILIEKRPPGM
jgi:hypothetical protein